MLALFKISFYLIRELLQIYCVSVLFKYRFCFDLIVIEWSIKPVHQSCIIQLLMRIESHNLHKITAVFQLLLLSHANNFLKNNAKI